VVIAARERMARNGHSAAVIAAWERVSAAVQRAVLALMIDELTRPTTDTLATSPRAGADQPPQPRETPCRNI
jgi:hypothetical protein